MAQQAPTIALPNVESSFLEVLRYNVLYHLKVDGVESVREELKRQRGWYSNIDGWSALQRELDDLILEYAQSQSSVVLAPSVPIWTNRIMKKYYDGHPIDFDMLHDIIGDCFVSNLEYKYDWLALWRILYDLTLLEDIHLTSFSKQMNEWYPGAAEPCTDDAMNNYSNPYLGITPHDRWTEEAFRLHQTKKQSLNGFWRLKNLCDMLEKQLDFRAFLRK